MYLNHTEFDVIYYLSGLSPAGVPTAEGIADAADISPKRAKETLAALEAAGLVSGLELTGEGKASLEDHRVKGAIILAAGVSSRFLPLSLERPKGLLKVGGETLIERQIRQLNEVGITDITVVVGYMKEQFFFLKDKYGVDIVENPDFRTMNNTSSVIRVIDRIKDAYICGSDHYFAENVFASHCFGSNYTVKFIHGTTDDYNYTLTSDGCFASLGTLSVNELALVGPGIFMGEDADTYADYLKAHYDEPETQAKLWEAVLIDIIDRVRMYPRVFADGVIYEFDNLDELREYDPTYVNNLNSDIIDNICRELDATPADLAHFTPMKIGLTNISFQFECKGEQYIYRYPGDRTELFLSRACEAEAEELAKELGLDETVVWIDSKTGHKISRFIEGCDYIDPYDTEGDQAEAMRMLHHLHDQRVQGSWDLDFMTRAEAYIDVLDKQFHYDFSPFMATHAQMVELSHTLDEEGHERVLCHNDTWFWNFLKAPDGKITLIDWEYAGNNWPAGDVADYTVSLEFDDDQYLALAASYEGHELSFEEKRFYIAVLSLCNWHWFCWAVYTEQRGSVVDDLQLWYDKALRYLGQARDMYGIE